MQGAIKRLTYLSIFLALFVSPWCFFNQKIITVEMEEKVFGNTALIFGTLVKEGKVSPLLKERLEMGIRLYEGDKTNTLVVSNTKQASLVMKDYLISRGIPEEDIVLDIEAKITRQSCQTPFIQDNSGSVLFVSQSFHLPRIYYECKKLGVHGNLVPAEYSDVIDRSNTSLHQILTIRVPRYVREMTILWSDIIFQKLIF